MSLSRDQFGVQHPLRVKPEGVYANERPGTQGQMVTGGHKQPWPKGYSPERRHEVEAALDNVDVWGHPDEQGDQRGRERWVEAYEIGKKQAQARIVKDVASSTVPPEDLAGLHEIHVSQDPYADALGTYEAVGSSSGGPIINLYPGAGQRTTVHEIGHHASHLAGNEHAAGRGYIRSAGARGREEAFADDYASRHAKGDDRSAYEYGTTSHAGSWRDAEDFRKAYVGHRSALSGQQFQPPEGSLLPAPQPEEPPQTSPSERGPRQPSFDEFQRHQRAVDDELLLPFDDWGRFSRLEPHEQTEKVGRAQVVKSHIEGKIPPIIGTRQMEAQTMDPFHRNRPRP